MTPLAQARNLDIEFDTGDAGVRTAALLKAQKPEIQRAIQTQLGAELQPFITGDVLNLPYAAHVIAIRAGH